MIRNGAVFVSTKYDIIRNLALEDWLYRNFKCSESNASFMLMWRNTPAIVIGRHQNPWLECRLKHLADSGVQLARRNSGGGTVYHDMGNLNCSFFTPRKRYNRVSNLGVICSALQKWGLDVEISERHDLLWNGFKISGTASKLGSENAYHHCTLLLSVNVTQLHQTLRKNTDGITSKATQSVRASVQNLSEACPNLNVEDIIREIGFHYQTEHRVPGVGLSSIEPREENFPGIETSVAQLTSWDWLFGKTPRFQVNRSFGFLETIPATYDCTSEKESVHITLSVFHGLVDALEFKPQLPCHLPALLKVRFVLDDVTQRLDQWQASVDIAHQPLTRSKCDGWKVVIDGVNLIRKGITGGYQTAGEVLCLAQKTQVNCPRIVMASSDYYIVPILRDFILKNKEYHNISFIKDVHEIEYH